MATSFAQLKELAGKLPARVWFAERTPGKIWVGTRKGSTPFYKCDDVFFGIETEGLHDEARSRAERLADFIAACSPDTILALINRVEELERERDEAQAFAGLGCTASHGGAHSVIKQGTYTFCGNCGETIRFPSLRERARQAEARVVELEKRETVLLDSQYIAGAKAGWNASQSDDPNEAFAALVASRNGYLEPITHGRRARSLLGGKS